MQTPILSRAAALALGTPLVAAQAAGPPPGFALNLLSTSLDSPTCLAVAPDGRVFVGEIDGDVWLYEQGAFGAEPVISIPVGVAYESAGLLGLELDPAFAQNGYLYAYFTTGEPRNRVSRFTVIGSSAALASELVVWQNVHPTPNDHNGGGLAFGADGSLFISTGDQFFSAYAQDLQREDGKLLRVLPDGSIPADNPYVGNPNAQPTIYASGLRNPFRLAADPVSGDVWICDVGGNGTTAWEELDRAAAGANYGWPFQEGGACYVSACSAYTPPVFAFRHDDPDWVPGPAQGSLTAVAVYRSGVFPPQYDGDLFVGDYANRWLARVQLDGGGSLADAQPFLPAPDAGPIAGVELGPDGALYFVTFDVPSGQGTDESALWRLSYGIGGNLPPVPLASASVSGGPVPLDVHFTGSQSYDPDGSPRGLSYHWDFGNGQVSTLADPDATFSLPGPYAVVLTVDDGLESVAAAPIPIAAGNPPQVQITAPLLTDYRAGDTLSFDGFATDVEDGSLALDALTWTVELVHETHVHPFYGPAPATTPPVVVVPTTGHPPEHTHLRAILSAIDSDGLQASATLDLTPVVVPITLRTYFPPSLTPIFVEGQAEPLPRVYESLAGYELLLEAPRLVWLGAQPWIFHEWTDEGARVHVATTPDEPLDLYAVYGLAAPRWLRPKVKSQLDNAEYSVGLGQAHQSASEPLGLRIGRDAQGRLEAAFAFKLDLPRGTTVLTAWVELGAVGAQNGHISTPIQAYDADDAPAFSAGSTTPLSQLAPLTSANVFWSMPAFVVGQTVATPDLWALVQEVVDRPGWQSGNKLGVVFTGSTGSLIAVRTTTNQASGAPATLVVRYAHPKPYAKPPSKHP